MEKSEIHPELAGRYSINLVNDFVVVLKEKLTEMGYMPDDTAYNMTVCCQYHNLNRRWIVKLPRTVKKSAEFRCPAEYEELMTKVEAEISTGSDLTPRLSTSIKNLSFNDGLLNDWAVHHLHLGKVEPGSHFVGRTRELLFAVFTDSVAYLVGVFDHQSWSKRKILSIIQNNWPDLLAESQLRDIVALETNPSDDERQQLRDAGINSFVELRPGVILAPPGGGVMSTGESAEVVTQCQSDFRKLRETEDIVKANLVHIFQRVLGKIGYEPSCLKFRLSLGEDRIRVIELTSRIVVVDSQSR